MTFASNINNLRRFFKVVTFLAAKIVQKIYYFFQNCPLIIQENIYTALQSIDFTMLCGSSGGIRCKKTAF